MLTSPWDLVLTLAFAFTGLVFAGELMTRRGGRPRDADGLSDGEVVDIAHALMSISMIVMIWMSLIDVATWTQVALFAILALALIPALRRASGTAHRIDLAGHIALKAAMIWMLAAMPLLMAGMDMGADGGSAHAGHGGGGDEAATLMATPAWADVVNWVLIVVCAVAALWWLYRLASARRHRMHVMCHAVMAAGMGTMLALMNA